MATVRCGKCGAELILPETSSFITGTTVSKESKGDYVLPMRDSKGRFTKKTTEYCETETNNNSNTKENTTMMNANNNTNGTVNNANVNGGMNMNGFDMNALTQMVAQMMQSQMNVQSQSVSEETVEIEEKKETYYNTVDGGRWAKGSKWYGKEICGFAFNPYMIRWHLQKEFERLMDEYNYNVYEGITEEYSYMYSVKETLKEVETLANLNRKDRIAYNERRYIYDLDSCKKVFADYIRDVISKIEFEENLAIKNNKVGKSVRMSLKKYGWFDAGIVAERIVNHKVEKYLARTLTFEAIYADLNRILEQLTQPYRIYSYKELANLMRDNVSIKVPEKHKKSKAFMDMFIKAGAYYTLKQTLMFKEGTVLKGTKNDGLTGREAVLELMAESKKKYNEGYIIYKWLKLTKGIRK